MEECFPKPTRADLPHVFISFILSLLNLIIVWLNF